MDLIACIVLVVVVALAMRYRVLGALMVLAACGSFAVLLSGCGGGQADGEGMKTTQPVSCIVHGKGCA